MLSIKQLREEIRSYRFPTSATTQPTEEMKNRLTGFKHSTNTYLDFIETLPPNGERKNLPELCQQTWNRGCECIHAGGEVAHGHGGGNAG